MSYATFKRRGIGTASGHLTSIEAMVQVLILPVLILCWALTIAVIASFT